MIFLGHVAGSYLISQIPAFFGQPLPVVDQSLIILAGNILDLDLLFPGFTSRYSYNHHFSPTHTPFFAVIGFSIFYLLFGRQLSPVTGLLMLVSLLVHLALDDISYWFTRLGLEKSSALPQIFWLYPFDTRRNLACLPQFRNLKKTLKNYYFRSPWTLSTELVLVVFAVVSHGFRI